MQTPGDHPFNTLLQLSASHQQNLSQLPAHQENVDYWRGVGFTLGGLHLVAPMGQVTEILKVPKVTQLPGVKSWVQGIANVRGRLLPILDLIDFFGLASSADSFSRRVFVVEKQDYANGVIVDAVLGMEQFPTAQYSNQNQAIIPDNLATYIHGEYHKGSEPWPVFDFYQLVDSADFYSVAV